MSYTPDNKRFGLWDKPIQGYSKEDRPIKVIIWNIEKDTVEDEFILNYGDDQDRRFLGKLTFFAITNKRSVETMLLEDYK